MDKLLKDEFSKRWRKYFPNSDWPIIYYYTDEEGHAEDVKPGEGSRCVMGQLVKVRQGKSLSFAADSVGCFGGKRYLGFSESLAPNFEYFLSCGIPGKMEGERYKKTPDIVTELMKRWPKFKAPARFIVFKRWDNLENADDPEVVVFYAKPDVLAGLYTLANYDESDPNAVITPMGSGCASIVANPYMEKDSTHPRAVIGMFDPSARPFVEPDELTIAIPLKKFSRMVQNMDESFLTTHTWETMRKRLK
jgi:uncharacterized protein (DUF169 family)